LVLLCCALLSVNAIDNGIGRLPPMGWRSWNCYGGNIDQQKMTATIDAISATTRQVNGKPTSLLQLGYERVGLDDNWQLCNAGINGSFHDQDGHPLINKQRFPDMKQMNDYAHGKKVKTGWYLNNCICNERRLEPNWPPQMNGDVDAIVSYGYDGVKIDGCGPSHNLLLWAQLINKTGLPSMIENCHDNTTFPYWHDPKTFDYVECPMNFWRVSDDINASWGSITSNLQHTIPYQDVNHPISQPGCWAYPDMLEVGNGALTHTESRSHFGAWCIVSSPLILGFDLTNSQKMDSVWDIITNTEAIQVSQTWAGHPGRLISQATETVRVEVPYSKNDLTRLSANGKLPTSSFRSELLAAWQVWAKPLSNKSYAAFLLNIADSAQTVSVKLSDLGYSSTTKLNVRDIWEKNDLPQLNGDATYSIHLDPHDSKFIRLTPQ